MQEDVLNISLFHDPRRNTPRDASTLEMVPITTGIILDINIRKLKALEEKGIGPCSYDNYIKGKHGTT